MSNSLSKLDAPLNILKCFQTLARDFRKTKTLEQEQAQAQEQGKERTLTKSSKCK